MKKRILSHILSGLSIANEDIANGIVSKEVEHMFYAKVDSGYWLRKATSIEIQEQWGLWQDKTDKNAGSGSVRIRKVISRDIVDGVVRNETMKTEYIMTTKIKTKEGDALEISIPTTEDNFKAFKILAESGMVKHRYTFPIPGTDLKWEADMFVKTGEDVMSMNYIDIVKLDLEVESKDTPIPELPEGFINSFDGKENENTTPEQLVIIKEMKEYLSLPNPFIKQVYTSI